MKKNIVRFVAIFISAVILTLSFAGCSEKKPATDNGNSSGTLVIELYPEYAPNTVDNFLKLVNSGFYDGLTFHRIVDDFMAQGGDPEGTGSGGSDPIYGEFAANGFTQNTLSHSRGVISMARQGNDYNSGSCQFFICSSDMYTSSLDGQYAAFGKVVSGMEVIDDLSNVERTYNSIGELASPVKPVTIAKAVRLNDYSDAKAGCHYVEMTIEYTVSK